MIWTCTYTCSFKSTHGNKWRRKESGQMESVWELWSAGLVWREDGEGGNCCSMPTSPTFIFVCEQIYCSSASPLAVRDPGSACRNAAVRTTQLLQQLSDCCWDCRSCTGNARHVTAAVTFCDMLDPGLAIVTVYLCQLRECFVLHPHTLLLHTHLFRHWRNCETRK